MVIPNTPERTALAQRARPSLFQWVSSLVQGTFAPVRLAGPPVATPRVDDGRTDTGLLLDWMRHFLQQGQHRWALECGRMILESEPDNWRARINLGTAHVGLQEPEQALRLIEEVLERHADNREAVKKALVQRTWIEYLQHGYDDGQSVGRRILHYEQILCMDPEHYVVRACLILCRAARREWDLIERCWDSAPDRQALQAVLQSEVLKLQKQRRCADRPHLVRPEERLPFWLQEHLSIEVTNEA